MKLAYETLEIWQLAVISPLIEKIHFKTMRSDQPSHPSEAINRFSRTRQGFTLIEILVVLGIFSVIAFIGTDMFFTILKGSTKTRVLTEVKQNGGYALSVMERMIRNARNLGSYTGNSITIVGLDGGKTTFACSGGKITLNGASLMSDQVAVENCDNAFSVNPGETGVQPDEVTIDFTLTQAAGKRGEEKATVRFKTTVTLRNY